jgi:hypothetical protein
MERVRSRRRVAKPTPAADSNVGYGKPPVHTRFKKGVSGNPSGLPKEGNERRRNASTRLAMQRALSKKAASGDAAAARLLWMMDRASAEEDSKPSTAEVLNTEADKLVVEQLVLRLREMIKGEDRGHTDTN